MAGGGGAEKQSGAAASQRRRGAPVVIGDSGEVLEHEGEERKVRGMTTYPERLWAALTGREEKTVAVA
jgi:hypothetical protein